MNWVLDTLKNSIRLKTPGDIVDWADGRIKLPHSTRYPVFVANEAPFLMEPLRALSDPNIRRVDVRGPAGGAKSLIGELHIGYVVDNEPGLYYYVWQSDDDARDSMEDRIIPMFDENEILSERLPIDPRKKRVTKIAFPTMPFYALGANANNAQSKRARYVTFEEPHLFKPGMIRAFEKRTEAVTRSKILSLSTGSIKDDQSDLSWQDGTCEAWEVPCPHCGFFQAMVDDKDRLRCDKNSNTIDDRGNYIWHKLLLTVRYNCVACGQDWPTDTAFRKNQAGLGKYVVKNPNARHDHRSFHYEALSVHWISLQDVLQEKLQASLAAKRGALEPLKDYIQKRRAMAWDEAPEQTINLDVKRMQVGYIKRASWPDQIAEARFLTLDNQAGKASKGEGAHRWYVCRAYGMTQSRVVDEGRLTTWEEAEELRIALGVSPKRTLVDIAFDTQQVQAICVKYGWQGLWGDNSKKKTFPHHEQVGTNRLVRNYPFSSPQVGHLGLGSAGKYQQAYYYFWAQQTIKNLYHRLREGLTSYQWTLPDDISREYLEHTSVEYKKQIVNSAGEKEWSWVCTKKDNHLLDCDQMNLVAALLDPRLRQILYGLYEDPVET